MGERAKDDDFANIVDAKGIVRGASADGLVKATIEVLLAD